MTQDPVVSLLLKSPLTPAQRRAASEAFTGSANEDDLQARMLALNLPKSIRADLWDLKVAAPPQPKIETPKAPEGSAAGRFLSNMGEMINPVSIVKGLYHTATSPIETGKAIIGQSADQLRKAGEAFGQGRYAEAAGHAGGAIPIVGPIAAEAGEQIASGDVAGGLGKAAGLLVPFGAAEGFARAGVRAAPIAAAERLEAGAASRYADVMSPKSAQGKSLRMGNKAEKIAPEIAKDTSNAAWSREGLQGNLEVKLKEAGASLDEVADARNAGKPYETKPIADALRVERAKLTAQPFEATHRTPEYRGRGARTARPDIEIVTSGEAGIAAEQLTPHQRGYRDLREGAKVSEPERAGVALGQEVVPGPNKARVAEIDRAIAEVEALGPVAPYEAIRRIRAAYDGPAEVRYNPAVTPDFLASQNVAKGSADVSGVLRDVLAKGDLETAAANANYSLYRSAVDVTKAARELERSRPRAGRQVMARLMGSIIGGSEGSAVGAVGGYVAGPVIDSMLTSGYTTKLQTAKLMQDLAMAIRSGDVGRVTSIGFRARQLMKQAEASRSRGSEALTPSRQEQ